MSDADPSALLSAARIAKVVGAGVVTFIEPTVRAINEVLSTPERSAAALPTVFEALKLLVKAIGAELEVALLEINSLLLKLPLSAALIEVFTEISEVDAVLGGQIQRSSAVVTRLTPTVRVLDLVSELLTGAPFSSGLMAQRPSSPKVATPTLTMTASSAASTGTEPSRARASTILALKTLSSFSFILGGLDIGSFTQRAVVPLLRDARSDVRTAAAEATTTVIGKISRTGKTSQRLLHETAISLVSLVLCDPGALLGREPN